MSKVNIKSKFLQTTDEVEVNGDDVASAVNEQITAGKIDIPAGGTKLYKHLISIDDSYDECFEIITNLPIIFSPDATLQEKIATLIDKQYYFLKSSGYSLSKGDSNLHNGVFFGAGEDTISYAGFDEDDGGTNYYTWSSITTLDDEITPL